MIAPARSAWALGCIVVALPGCAPKEPGNVGPSTTSSADETTASVSEPTTGLPDATTIADASESSGAPAADTSTLESTDSTTDPTTDPTTSSETTGAGGPCDPVVFADPALEAAVRDQLEIPQGPISGEAILELDQIGSSTPVAALTGLECAVNLIGIHMNKGTFTDLSPLAGLPKLASLNLVNGEIVDISPLVGLQALHHLDLHSNKIVDLTPVAALVSTPEIILSDNQITDLSPLVGLVWDTSPNGCGDLFLELNPLTPATVEQDLPALCDTSGLAVRTDLGQCIDNTCLNP